MRVGAVRPSLGGVASLAAGPEAGAGPIFCRERFRVFVFIVGGRKLPGNRPTALLRRQSRTCTQNEEESCQPPKSGNSWTCIWSVT